MAVALWYAVWALGLRDGGKPRKSPTRTAGVAAGFRLMYVANSRSEMLCDLLPAVNAMCPSGLLW